MYINIVYRVWRISTLWTDVYKQHKKNKVYCFHMETPISTQEPTINTQENLTEEVSEDTFNVYPIIRHIFLTLCILLAIVIILFLIYQNGKSIYDKGI